jgi:hypothetical protein
MFGVMTGCRIVMAGDLGERERETVLGSTKGLLHGGWRCCVNSGWCG